jgi:hypothetical protein
MFELLSYEYSLCIKRLFRIFLILCNAESAFIPWLVYKNVSVIMKAAFENEWNILDKPFYYKRIVKCLQSNMN